MRYKQECGQPEECYEHDTFGVPYEGEMNNEPGVHWEGV
jgi:hypothetical protein